MMRNKAIPTSDKRIILLMVTCVFLLFSINILRTMYTFKIDTNALNNFYTIFISMILEGFPFIIIGALISSFIQIFISDEIMLRLVPKNKMTGLLLFSLVGLIFPVCDCAIIPVTKRLIKKGISTGMAITFMLSTPIINPIVLISTYYAFRGSLYILIYRVVFGIVAAIIIGYLMDWVNSNNIVLNREESASADYSNCHHHHCCSNNHEHNHKANFLYNIMSHTSEEVYDIGKLFIIGALISSSIQTYIPRHYILSIGHGKVSSIIVMFILAYTLCICSQTDAFIARTFLSQFTAGSIIGFLILGPMLDIKNTLMIIGSFKKSFAIKLISSIIVVCFIMSILGNYIIPFSLKLL